MIDYEVAFADITGPLDALPFWGRTSGAEEFVYCCEVPAMPCRCQVVIWRKEAEAACKMLLYDTGFFRPPAPRSGLQDLQERLEDVKEQLRQKMPVKDVLVECSPKEWTKMTALLKKTGLLLDQEPEPEDVISESEVRLVAFVGGKLYDYKPGFHWPLVSKIGRLCRALGLRD
jgi:hypothetical protein